MGKFLGLFGTKGGNVNSACPNLTVEFLLQQKSIYLKVANISILAAYDVHISPDRPIIGLNGTKDLSKLAIFRGLPYMGPGKEFEIFVDLLDLIFLHNKESKITFKVTYSDKEGKKYSDRIVHDLNNYRDLPINSSACI